jgi:hypothetical protein
MFAGQTIVTTAHGIAVVVSELTLFYLPPGQKLINAGMDFQALVDFFLLIVLKGKNSSGIVNYF